MKTKAGARKMPAPSSVFSIAVSLALVLSACATAPLDRSNLDRCLADDYTCNSTLLTAEEIERLIEVRGPQHFLDCLAGRRCNESLLSTPELAQVRAATGQINFESCLWGEAICSREKLSDEQRSEVEQAGHARNFMYCLSGLSACDRSALTHAQLAAAHSAYLQRNFAGCMNSVGTLLSCNPDDLSPEQRELVQKRNLAVNFFVCSNALIGCVDELLTPRQRAELEAMR